MKILISSKRLAEFLNKLITEDCLEIEMIVADGRDLTFFTSDKSEKLWDCEILRSAPMVKQRNRRWDGVKKIVNAVNEQPIELEIYEEVVNVIFRF